jgi:hypothetical protein
VRTFTATATQVTPSEGWRVVVEQELYTGRALPPRHFIVDCYSPRYAIAAVMHGVVHSDPKTQANTIRNISERVEEVVKS